MVPHSDILLHDNRHPMVSQSDIVLHVDRRPIVRHFRGLINLRLTSSTPAVPPPWPYRRRFGRIADASVARNATPRCTVSEQMVCGECYYIEI